MKNCVLLSFLWNSVKPSIRTRADIFVQRKYGKYAGPQYQVLNEYMRYTKTFLITLIWILFFYVSERNERILCAFNFSVWVSLHSRIYFN